MRGIFSMPMFSSNMCLVYLMYVTVVIPGVVSAGDCDVVVLAYFAQYFQFCLLVTCFKREWERRLTFAFAIKTLNCSFSL